MQGPIDYSSLLTQLDVSPLQNGLALRQRNQAVQAEQQAQQQRVQLAQSKFSAEQANDTAYQNGLREYFANPSPEALLALGARFPEHQKALQDGAATYSEGQKNDLVKTIAWTLGSLSSGKTDVARKTIVDRKEALKNGGINDDQTSQLLELIDGGHVKEAMGMLGYGLGGLVGIEHAGSMLENLGIGAKAADRAEDNARQDRRDRENAAYRAETLGLARQREGRIARNSGGKGSAKAAKPPAGFILD